MLNQAIKSWLIVAREYEAYYETGKPNEYSATGLCNALYILFHSKVISYLTHALMQEQLFDYRDKTECINKPTFIWPVQKEFALERAKLARKFAKELHESKGKE
jgi:hypothetical protein